MPGGHSFPDATGVAFALMAWARHRCLQLYLLFFFSKMNRIFEGLNMLQNSRNFAHASELGKIYIWYGFQKWVWQNGSTAPPIHVQRCAPRATFHVHVWKSVHTCNSPIPTKKTLGAKSETQQEVGYFEFSLQN